MCRFCIQNEINMLKRCGPPEPGNLSSYVPYVYVAFDRMSREIILRGGGGGAGNGGPKKDSKANIKRRKK